MLLEFSLGVRLTHFFNFLFMTLLVRSGIEILGAHPKLYWQNHCSPGSEWARFTRKKMPKDQLWTAEDEMAPYSPWISLPGRKNLGLGRHWHFWSVLGWLLCGLAYVVTIFVTPEWRRLVPTSWSIVPQAWHAAVTYLHLDLPPEPGRYNALQQLSYFLVIFGLTPFQILTGLSMSPALSSHFPRVFRVLGGRQVMRSLHFLGLLAFVLFFIVHLVMVIWHGFAKNMAMIVLGSEHASHTLAVWIGMAGILLVIALNVIATRASLKKPELTKRVLEVGVDPLRRLLFHHWVSKQDHGSVSFYPRVNGRPPKNDAYVRSAEAHFADWHLRVDGLVQDPLDLSLEEVRAMPRTSHTSLHICIQGWSYFATWAGVPISQILEQVHPKPEARYLVFHTLDDKWEDPGKGYYYEVIDLETARKPQVILAYEMNGMPLPVEHGAPLRLRIENQLGYKMAKWVNHIELVSDFRGLGKGQGGWRDDELHYYPSDAGI